MTTRTPLRILATQLLSIGFAATLVWATPGRSWAPTMVDGTLEDLRSHGYRICEPTISQLPAEDAAAGTYADAIAPPGWEACEIRFAVGIDPKHLDWIAHHEVCHLATMNTIDVDPASGQFEDPLHHHPLFLRCLDLGPADRGGY